MPAMTRGPLPPGVYWRRRAFVGLLALGLVLLIGSWLVGGSDGSSDEDPVAQQAGAVEDATHTVKADESTKPTKRNKDKGKNKKKSKKAKKAEKAEARLAEPSGRCAPADVVVTPIVKKAVAGRPVTITLSLQTQTSEACHWRVGPKRVAIKITDAGGEEVWSSRHCKALAGRRVVVRRTVATEVTFTWDARASDDGCPEDTEWMLPGEFAIVTAAYGGEPTSAEFKLAKPTAENRVEKLEAEGRKGNALDRIKQR